MGKDRRKYKGVMPPARRHLCFHHLLTHTFSWQQLFPVSPPKILSMGVDRDGSQFCNTRWKFFSLLSLLLIQLSLHPSLFVPCTQRVRVYFSAGSLELEWADDLDLGVV